MVNRSSTGNVYQIYCKPIISLVHIYQTLGIPATRVYLPGTGSTPLPLESVTKQHTTMATTTQKRAMTACRYSAERKKNLLPHKIMAFLILLPTTNRLGRHKNNSSYPVKTTEIRLKTITTEQRRQVHKNREQIVNIMYVQLLPRLKPV